MDSKKGRIEIRRVGFKISRSDRLFVKAFLRDPRDPYGFQKGKNRDP